SWAPSTARHDGCASTWDEVRRPRAPSLRQEGSASMSSIPPQMWEDPKAFPTPFDEEQEREHRHHEDHGDHEHGEGCGHDAVEHGDHVDYVHDGHRHWWHAGHGHWHEHDAD